MLNNVIRKPQADNVNAKEVITIKPMDVEINSFCSKPARGCQVAGIQVFGSLQLTLRKP